MIGTWKEKRKVRWITCRNKLIGLFYWAVQYMKQYNWILT